MELVKKNISFHLREYRRKNHLTQEKFAEKLGISVEFYGEIERQKKLPGTALIIKIYREMGFDYIPLCETPKECTGLTEILNATLDSPELLKLYIQIVKSLK